MAHTESLNTRRDSHKYTRSEHCGIVLNFSYFRVFAVCVFSSNSPGSFLAVGADFFFFISSVVSREQNLNPTFDIFKDSSTQQHPRLLLIITLILPDNYSVIIVKHWEQRLQCWASSLGSLESFLLAHTSLKPLNVWNFSMSRPLGQVIKYHLIFLFFGKKTNIDYK